MSFYEMFMKRVSDVKKQLDEYENKVPKNEGYKILEVEENIEKLEEKMYKNKDILEENYNQIHQKIPQLKKIVGFLENGIKKVYMNSYKHDDIRDNLDFNIRELNGFIDEIKRIPILKKLSKADKNIVIVGANGSGKSSLADYLKTSVIPNILVFPAQKYLIMDENIYRNGKIAIDIKELKDEQQNKKTKENNDLDKSYTNLITALINDHLDFLNKKDSGQDVKQKISTYKSMENIFKELIPDIRLELNTNIRTIIPNKNGQEYKINQLSDGEKVLILYIGQILLAEKDSYIIIDEPETYLNFSTSNKLWDLLCEKREDCKFIFITHNIDFIISRKNSEIIWCKSYIYPNEWELEELLSNENIPLELMTELAGSKKPIIFCEGDKKSYDYETYSRIFSESYTIHPVGGHRNVVEYTKAYMNSEVFNGRKSYGIIDGDLSREELKYKTEDNIVVLPVNEIEMFLLDEKIIEAVLESNFEKNIMDQKISKFKVKFKEKMENKKNEIILARLKKELDELLEKEKIQNYKTLELVKKSFSHILNFEFENKYNEYEIELDNILESIDYPKMLKWCSLKKEISSGLANQELDSEYLRKALNQISRNKVLRNELKEEYFSKIKGD